MNAAVQRELFGFVGGRTVERYILRNAHGVELHAISYGGIITSLVAPDRDGVPADVVLGFDTLDQYIAGHPYFGAIIGRYANRIAHGRMPVDGITYQLPVNAGSHHLHGGRSGFDRAIWHVEILNDNGTGLKGTGLRGTGLRGTALRGIVLTHVSPDGDQGYPGTLAVQVTYELTDANELVIDYDARADRATHVNLTQHSYFNLAGEGGDVLAHRLRIDADCYTPVDATMIPTGEIAAVAGTRFDFREPRAIGGDYDHNWVVNNYDGTLRRIAHAVEPNSGRTLTVASTQPGLQFYTGNFLDGTLIGKSGRPYVQHAGLCLETQHFPDSPNHPNFPSTLLREGERYHSRTVFTFGVSK